MIGSRVVGHRAGRRPQRCRRTASPDWWPSHGAPHRCSLGEDAGSSASSEVESGCRALAQGEGLLNGIARRLGLPLRAERTQVGRLVVFDLAGTMESRGKVSTVRFR